MKSWSKKDLQRLGIAIDKKGKANIEFENILVADKKKFGLNVLMQEVFIPYEVMSSKNSKQIFYKDVFNKETNKIKKVPFITDSEQVKRYKEQTESYYKNFASVFRNMASKYPLPLLVEFTFYRKTKAKFDFANMIQVICDLMQEYEWIEDDCITHLLPIPNLEHPFYISKDNPGVAIRILNSNPIIK